MLKISLTNSLILIAVAAQSGCSEESVSRETSDILTAAPSDWDAYDEETFTFRAPGSFVDQNPQGIDSQVGKFTTETCTLSYDYGAYSGSYDEYADDVSYLEETVSIDGEIATFVILDASFGDDDRDFTASVHFRDLGESSVGSIKLTMTLRCSSNDDREANIPILGSIDFM